MDAEKLKSLQIDPQAKSRSSGALWMIFLAVIVGTIVIALFMPLIEIINKMQSPK